MPQQTITLWPLGVAVLLCGCGGSSGSVASAPLPVPTPAPTSTPAPAEGATDKIIGAANVSQGFMVQQYAPTSDGGVTIRFDAGTGHYLITTPASTTPAPLMRAPNYQPIAGEPWKEFSTGGFRFAIRASADDTSPDLRYTYSNLAAWSYPESPDISGFTAFGIATPESGVPQTGRATYNGFLEGKTSEQCACGGDGDTANGSIAGSVNLSFDFGSGSLSGTVRPRLGLTQDHDLGPLVLDGLGWSKGGASFTSGLTGPSVSNAGLRGNFTGSSAQELIGSLWFDYNSPVDSLPQSAGGAFIAKKAP